MDAYNNILVNIVIGERIYYTYEQDIHILKVTGIKKYELTIWHDQENYTRGRRKHDEYWDQHIRYRNK
jgi:hypothetical protein